MISYEDRIRSITSQINLALPRWQRPDHLTNEAALTVLRDMAEAVNARISASLPLSAIEGRVERCVRNLIETYRGRAWPTPAHFVDAMAASAEPVEREVKTNFEVDPIKRTIERMRAGDPVSDSYLWGRLAREIEVTGEIPTATFDAYREGYQRSIEGTYRVETVEAIMASLWDRHRAAKVTGDVRPRDMPAIKFKRMEAAE